MDARRQDAVVLGIIVIVVAIALTLLVLAGHGAFSGQPGPVRGGPVPASPAAR